MKKVDIFFCSAEAKCGWVFTLYKGETCSVGVLVFGVFPFLVMDCEVAHTMGDENPQKKADVVT